MEAKKKTSTDFHLKSGLGRFGWCGSTRAITRRNGRQSHRSRRRSAARARRCEIGFARRNAIRGLARARRRMIASGSRRWSGKTANCGKPTRFCARRRLILRWRSSTADTSHDRLHRRSPRGARGRTGLQCFADRPSTYRAHAARRRDPAKGSARARRDAVLRGKIRRVFDETSRFTARARCGGR